MSFQVKLLLKTEKTRARRGHRDSEASGPRNKRRLRVDESNDVFGGDSRYDAIKAIQKLNSYV
jgi:hypothetical protein